MQTNDDAKETCELPDYVMGMILSMLKTSDLFRAMVFEHSSPLLLSTFSRLFVRGGCSLFNTNLMCGNTEQLALPKEQNNFNRCSVHCRTRTVLFSIWMSVVCCVYKFYALTQGTKFAILVLRALREHCNQTLQSNHLIFQVRGVANTLFTQQGI